MYFPTKTIIFHRIYKNKCLHFGKNCENSQMQKGKTTLICWSGDGWVTQSFLMSQRVKALRPVVAQVLGGCFDALQTFAERADCAASD